MSKIFKMLFPSAKRALELDQYSKKMLPAWGAQDSFSEDQAVGLSTIFRAIEIISNSMIQLPIMVERNGEKLPRNLVPGFIKDPWLGHSRSDFIEYLTNSLVLNGNAFFRVFRSDSGKIINLVPLPPSLVSVESDEMGSDTYSYNGERFSQREIKHIYVKRLPGRSRGIGPIQAARLEISGHIRTARYGARYFDDNALPIGVLTSEQALTADDSARAKDAWYSSDNLSSVRVLGKGLKFQALEISPKDAQFIESQQFSVVQVARLFGVPSSLMLATLDGNSQTYSNVEQDWIGYVRFTLMGYVKKIEESLTELVPYGQKVKFNLDGLLRSDTKTRYASYEIGISNRFLTVNEARALEGMEPLTEAQIAEFRTLENLGKNNEN